ncbi:LOW QUALITY PROTEIN: uncharacterized protein LOC110226198 [Arabidopsis lyrata subsp. lyrata]|uniref:LOW QUALITY PROTEIN: uncharacterized protein LOC110226198 n=1 Tax=Arabidopsis lyrata subsp. lyrata TaxID=81972 RepID=UPI000A29CED4|nr:LOW QUALITY PROTEIN: uncharacterized protein LOC110226198 [Arabidopsis lyrata subsp. lyrata]|eukprot:XP_020872590.1 LOW QUALITY PROTEIN: uncharacterized protein LOC110226198 [Arabidopsis lyrata subsp. lyrata]
MRHQRGDISLVIDQTKLPLQDRPKHPNLVDDGRRNGYLDLCVPLCQAAMKGDWESALTIINRRPEIIREAITFQWETPLHIAVASKHKHFVKNLLEFMAEVDLYLQDKDGNTAFSFAAASGVVEIARLLEDKTKPVSLARGAEDLTPIHIAALFTRRDMVVYLNENTDFIDDLIDAGQLTNFFLATISADIFGETALHLMARKPSSISLEKQLNQFQRLANSSNFQRLILAHQLVEEIWKSIAQRPGEEIWDFINSPRNLLFDAVQSGNIEFLNILLLRSCPDLLWKVDEKNQSIFHVAALHRHASIFNIIYELGARKDLVAFYKEPLKNENILHLVARLPSPDRLQMVPGAALQMQRELLWFEAVKEIVPHTYIKAENVKGETPHAVFIKEHENLRKEGEKWMKQTATACILVAALIATVLFTAAFTVPGGIKESTGLPNFAENEWFDTFTKWDIIGLFTSVDSVVIFLSILTSRYAEDDFRKALPAKLVLGLTTLFESIIAMVVCFTATMILIRDHTSTGRLILICFLAALSILFFVGLHFRIWLDTVISICKSSFLFHRRTGRIYP